MQVTFRKISGASEHDGLTWTLEGQDWDDVGRGNTTLEDQGEG